MTEPCKFEGDIAVLKSNTDEIKGMVEKIFTTLEGKNGLVTKVELLEQDIEDLPTPNTLKFHASVGGGIVVFLGLLAYAALRLL